MILLHGCPKRRRSLMWAAEGGYISRLLVKKGFRVIGVDISGNVVKLARKNVPGAKFYKMDMRKLKFGAGSFDGITSFYAIIHVPRKIPPAGAQGI